MESRETEVDPDGVVDLMVTLSDGPPVPLSLVAEAKNRADGTEFVVQTTQMQVRLRTSGPSPANSDTEQSLSSTMYPNLALDPRYNKPL